MAHTPIKVTKLEAARRQLATAIELYFNDGDPVSIHTLAVAAHQLIHDINRKKKGPPLFFDAEFIKPEHKTEFIGILKRDANFFKHADRGRTGQLDSIDFVPFGNEVFLSMAVLGLKHLGEKLNKHEVSFLIWETIQRPDLLTDAAMQLLKDSVPVEQINLIRKTSKKDFFNNFLQVWARNYGGSN